MHADEEAARLGGEGDLGGQVDGHGEGEALVVVGVVADERDASGGAGGAAAWRHAGGPGGGHGPSLTPAGRSGDDPAMADTSRSGPLTGIKIIELAGIGPSPYTNMMLADAGAQVIRLERALPGAVARGAEQTGPYWDLLNRSRPSVGIDLKHPDALELATANRDRVALGHDAARRREPQQRRG